jgi:excisionase family DNA binding protein
MNSEPIMTVDEVSVYLNLHPLTVRRLARDGEIPAMKIGRQWRFKRDLLDQWLEQQSLKNVVVPPDTETESE